MTAAASPPPAPDSPPFADASPAQVRAALVPEDAAEFDREWRGVMTRATESLDLAEVSATLDAWRRTAWLTAAKGPDAYRRMLRNAERTLQTGERAPGAVPWQELKMELGLDR